MGATEWLLSRARVQTKKHKGAGLDDVAAFFQQLNTLLNAGTPLMSALRMYSDQSESLKLGKIVREISEKIAGGHSFFKAASDYPDIFAVQWLFMIRTGEATGRLQQVMAQLSDGIQKSRATRSTVISAMIYPIILAVVAVTALAIMVFQVIPTFEEFFKDFGGQLPAITQAVLDLSKGLRSNGIVIVSVLGVGGFSARLYLKTERGAMFLRSLLLSLPLAGDLIVQVAMEKFAYNLALLLESGCPLLEAMRTTQEVFRQDPIYFNALGSVHASISRGNSIAVALWGTHLFTNMSLNLIKVGEESGKLPQVLHEMADYYGKKVELGIHRLTSLMEPVIIIGMGLMMGVILASLYIPMFNLAGAAK
jgi:type IV pilus assembly protein PilC